MRLIVPSASPFDSGERSKRILNDTLKEAGVLEAKRVIYLFVDPEEYKNDYLTSADCILVNTSLVDGGKRINNRIFYNSTRFGKSNSVHIELNVYYLIAHFNGAPMSALKDVHFSLVNAYGTGVVTNYIDKRSHPIEVSLMSTDDLFNVEEFMNPMGQDLVPPDSYTPEHMHVVTDDWVDIRMEPDYITYFSGDELIDANSKIEIYDRSKWNGLNRGMESRFNEISSINSGMARFDRTTDIGVKHDSDPDLREIDQMIDMFQIVSQSMISGTVMTYDTHDGWNLKGGKIPHADHIMKNKIGSDINYMTKNFVSYAESIEKEFGAVRIFYSPFNHGDQSRIICKDYKRSNQPFMNIPKSHRGDLEIPNDASRSHRGNIVSQRIKEDSLSNSNMILE